MTHSDLIHSSLFSGIDKEKIEKFLTKFCKKKQIKKDEILCRQNDLGDNMYLLESGKLEIILEEDFPGGDPNKHTVIASIESGAVIGELCIFGQKKRSATIRAVNDCKLLSIEGAEFRKGVENSEIIVLQITYNIAQLLSHRLVKANEFVRKLHQRTERNETKSELEFYRQRFFDESLFN